MITFNMPKDSYSSASLHYLISIDYTFKNYRTQFTITIIGLFPVCLYIMQVCLYPNLQTKPMAIVIRLHFENILYTCMGKDSRGYFGYFGKFTKIGRRVLWQLYDILGPSYIWTRYTNRSMCAKFLLKYLTTGVLTCVATHGKLDRQR